MADDGEPQPAVEEEEADVGPMPPPPGADEEEEEADVGPVLPKAKKRKVGLRGAAVKQLLCWGSGTAAVLGCKRAAAAGAHHCCAPRPAAAAPLGVHPASCPGGAVLPLPATTADAASVLPSLCPPQQVLEYEQQYMQALPLSDMYEKSYMHRDTGA